MFINKFLSNSSPLLRRSLNLKFSNLRNISMSSSLKDIFKIQDEEDYKQKVLNNKKVVIVDFFAT